MSTYHYAILAYGYGLGDNNQHEIEEVDQYGTMNLPWVHRDEDGWPTEDLTEAFTRRLYEAIPEADRGDASDSHDQGDAVKHHFGVKILEHGWLAEGDTASYALIASHKMTEGGNADPVDLRERLKLQEDKDFDGRLRKALDILGVTPKQTEPSWLLMATR